jgi:chromosomal replication initiator protein
MTPTIATIGRAVAEAAGITEEAIVGFEQARAVARPRQVAMYLCRRNGPWSLSAIGAEGGNHSHQRLGPARRRGDDRAPSRC